jgi:hypothetical protein
MSKLRRVLSWHWHHLILGHEAAPKEGKVIAKDAFGETVSVALRFPPFTFASLTSEDGLAAVLGDFISAVFCGAFLQHPP